MSARLQLLAAGAGFLLASLGVVAVASWDQAAGAELLRRPPAQRIDAQGLLTVDARDSRAWVSVSIPLGRVVPNGALADLSVRRYRLKAPRGAVDLGLTDSPRPPLRGWLLDRDDTNPALDRWYRYRWLRHTLASLGHTYAIRLEQGVGYLQILSYACAPEGNGCLTLRLWTTP